MGSFVSYQRWFRSWPVWHVHQARYQQWEFAQSHNRKPTLPTQVTEIQLNTHNLTQAEREQNKQKDSTFSSSSSTAFAISFFCSKTSSRSNFGTLALITGKQTKTPNDQYFAHINSLFRTYFCLFNNETYHQTHKLESDPLCYWACSTHHLPY